MATKSYSRTRTLVECALMIAVGTVLAQIKIFEMPFGGSVTLVSMLPFILVSFRHGVKWGRSRASSTAFADLPAFTRLPPALWPFVCRSAGLRWLSPFGLAGVIAKPFKNHLLGVAAGTAAVCVIRFLCSFLSGALLWGSYQESYEWARGMSVWLYSFIYNGSYMLPELLITTVCAVILCKAAPKFFLPEN
ncbi:MAG: energy-coupled thiamine transporter ThiT [Ruthenibacterium lactatiformans]